MWFFIRNALRNRKAQEGIPGWMFVVGLILLLIFLIFVIWLSLKGGSAAREQLFNLR